MPHVNGSSDGDDMGDADEIKVFKHDEECEEEKKLIAEERQSDSLTEDKSSLVTEGESQVLQHNPNDAAAIVVACEYFDLSRICPFAPVLCFCLLTFAILGRMSEFIRLR